MMLSFSTNAFVRYSVFKAIERISEIGYEGVELLADIPHLYIHSVTDSDIKRVKETVDHLGIKIANINANTAMGYYGKTFWEPLFEPSISNPNAVARKWRMDYTKKCIAMAHTLGAPSVSITPGRMVPGTPPEQSMDILRESLKELVEYAAQKNIRIGIEYEPGLLIEFYTELALLLNEVHSPYLGANLDLGHSYMVGEDLEKVIETLSDKIFHVHLEDIKGRKHYHLIPGAGDMDFEAIFNTLERNGYTGFVTVELYTYSNQPDEAARRSLRYLRELPYWVSPRLA